MDERTYQKLIDELRELVNKYTKSLGARDAVDTVTGMIDELLIMREGLKPSGIWRNTHD